MGLFVVAMDAEMNAGDDFMQRFFLPLSKRSIRSRVQCEAKFFVNENTQISENLRINLRQYVF